MSTDELYPQTFIESLLGRLPGRIKYHLHRCWKPGCGREGIECFLPDNETQGTEHEKPDEYYCVNHAQAGGYCWCCGQFYAGQESFDFGLGLCENCEEEFDCWCCGQFYAGQESFDFGLGLCENCEEEFDDELTLYDDEAVDDYDVGFNGEWFEDPADNPQSVLTDEEYYGEEEN